MEGFNRAECNGCNNRKRLNWNPVNDTHAPSILSRMLELVQQLPMMSHAAQDPTLKTCRIMRDHFREALPLAECHTVDEHVKPVLSLFCPMARSRELASIRMASASSMSRFKNRYLRRMAGWAVKPICVSNIRSLPGE